MCLRVYGYFALQFTSTPLPGIIKINNKTVFWNANIFVLVFCVLLLLSVKAFTRVCEIILLGYIVCVR